MEVYPDMPRMRDLVETATILRNGDFVEIDGDDDLPF